MPSAKLKLLGKERQRPNTSHERLRVHSLSMWLKDLGAWYAGWSKTEIGVAVALLLAALTASAKVHSWWTALVKARKEAREAERSRRSEALQSFSEKMLQEATRHYVEQNCSDMDPAKELDLRASLGVQESAIAALERELKSGSTRHVLVLADSGMGKTTLLLNLLERDLTRADKDRLGMLVVSLAFGDALERIGSIKRKNERVLLLDALDEDARAISDHRARLGELMQAARDFGATVLTCRTQFFSKDEEIPRDVGIVRIEPRPAGQDQAMTFRKLYLKPYDPSQVKEFLRKTIPWWQYRIRRRADQVAGRMHDLISRPMLLALVPDLARANYEVNEVHQLYNFMVESWFHRERTWIHRDTLRAASKLLAVEMFTKRHLYGAESLSRDDIQRVIEPLSTSIESWKLERRSLLNRDHADRFKFAHRSIMEFFFVSSALEGDWRALSVAWTDQMCELLYSWARTVRPEDARAVAARFIGTRNYTGVITSRTPAQQGDEVSADALNACLVQHDERSLAAVGFPQAWRALVVKVESRDRSSEVLDLADATVWKVPPPYSDRQQRAGRYVNFDAVVHQAVKADSVPPLPERPGPYRDSIPNDPAPPLCTLPQFVRLVRSLAHAGRLWQVLGASSRYWLRTSARAGWFMVSIRQESELDDDEIVPGSSAKRFYRQAQTFNGQQIQFSLYRSTSRNEQALSVFVEDNCVPERFERQFPLYPQSGTQENGLSASYARRATT